MNTETLEATSRRSAEKLIELIIENEDEILKAIEATLLMATDKDQETGGVSIVKFAINHKIILNLSNSTQTDALSFSVMHKSEIVQSIPDPNQPELL